MLSPFGILLSQDLGDRGRHILDTLQGLPVDDYRGEGTMKCTWTRSVWHGNSAATEPGSSNNILWTLLRGRTYRT
jgi:hypothetical protein